MRFFVSNPSRGYSTFLPPWGPSPQNRKRRFQTLPGVILHFYPDTDPNDSATLSRFQTLPGVILHFYEIMRLFPRRKHYGFKPFQGLFYISTNLSSIINHQSLRVSNPSRGYSTFLLRTDKSQLYLSLRFKPFQGLFYISTQRTFKKGGEDLWSFKPFQGLFYISTWKNVIFSLRRGIVSNPSRGYSTFLRSLAAGDFQGAFVSNPSRGYSTFLPYKFAYKPINKGGFKPFQGLFYISTIDIRKF